MNISSALRTSKGVSMWRLLSYILGGLCTAILTAMVVLTAADIAGRYWFNSPISGAYELTQLLLGSLIFAALPLTTYSQEHVEVDIFYHMAASFPKRIMRVLGAIVSSVALGVISWRLAIKALKLARDGSVTDALSLPLANIAWFGSIAFALSAILALICLAQFSLSDEMIEIGMADND